MKRGLNMLDRPLVTTVTLLCGMALAAPAAAQDAGAGLEEDATSKTLRDSLTSEAVLIVYGTSGDEATTEGLRRAAADLEASLEQKMDGRGWPITVRADSEVSLPELGGCLLFLVGTVRSNVILTLNASSFPLTVGDDAISVGKERFEGADVAATFAMINPFNPDHYAVVVTGVTDEAIWTAPDYAYDEIGYVVANAEGVLARGQFDTTIPEYWTILPGAGVGQVSAQLQADAVSIGVEFKPEQPLAGLEDHSLYMLGIGPELGVADLQGFVMPYLGYLHANHGVRLVGIEAPLWMSRFLDDYVVDGTLPPEELELPEETAAFVEELRSYNKGLAAGKRIHLTTFDLNHDVFTGKGTTLLPLKTIVGRLKDRETRKALSAALGEASAAYEGGNPAAMLQAIKKLNEAVAVAALKKKIPADDYGELRAYLDTEKTSIFYHQPENAARRGDPALQEVRARILRQNMTELVRRSMGEEIGAPALFVLHSDHCNKGAPGRAYGRTTAARYFDKVYEPTWDKVHVLVAYAVSGGYYDEDLHSLEVLPSDFTPDEIEAQAASLAQPNSLVYVPFTDPFWHDNRITVSHVWTWPGRLYDAMGVFVDVQPASGKTIPVGR